MTYTVLNVKKVVYNSISGRPSNPDSRMARALSGLDSRMGMVGRCNAFTLDYMEAVPVRANGGFC